MNLSSVLFVACSAAACGSTQAPAGAPPPPPHAAASAQPAPPSLPNAAPAASPQTSDALPQGSAVPPTPVSASYFVGVWTTSTTSYEDAARATDATRFGADGTMATGSWSAHRGFVPAPSAGRSPGFVPRYEIALATPMITFALDGAEERATFVVEGHDRWKTVVTTQEGRFVVYYRRRG